MTAHLTVASGLLTLPAQRFDPVFASQAVFRALLTAMARPGAIGRLPAHDAGCPFAECQAVAGVARTLLDHEVSFAAIADTGRRPGREDALATYLGETTGARLVAAVAADYVLLLEPSPAALLPALRRGRPAYPDESATVIASVPSFAPGAGTSVALSGPGVAPGTELILAGWDAQDVAALEEANAETPLGIDLILVTPGGQVAALPRPTRLRIVGRE